MDAPQKHRGGVRQFYRLHKAISNDICNLQKRTRDSNEKLAADWGLNIKTVGKLLKGDLGNYDKDTLFKLADKCFKGQQHWWQLGKAIPKDTEPTQTAILPLETEAQPLLSLDAVSCSMESGTLTKDAENLFQGLEGNIRRTCWNELYRWKNCFADAIRLVGRDAESFPVERVHISIDPSRYLLPYELRRSRAKDIARIEKYMDDNHTDFFNGKCIRLSSCDVSTEGEDEKTHLKLTLGKMYWYDYVLGNQRFGDPEIKNLFSEQFDPNQFIDFNKLILERAVGASKLSNIVTAYVTMTTSDGYMICSERSARGVASNKKDLISAVSENINGKKDGVFGKNRNKSIFNTAARGIEEEVSPYLRPENPTDILLLGLEYHLKVFNPGMIFYAPLPLKLKDFVYILLRHRGRHFWEGQVAFIDLNKESHIAGVLNRSDWFPGGKASVIRTLEYLEAKRKPNSSLADTAASIARGIKMRFPNCDRINRC